MMFQPLISCVLLTSIVIDYTAAQCTWKDRNPVLLRDCPSPSDPPYEAYCSSVINYGGSIQCEENDVWINPINGFTINLNDCSEDPFGEPVTSLIKLIITNGSLNEIPSTVYDMSKLTEMTITGNKIRKVSINSFVSMSNLKRINLSNNTINIIEVNEVLSGYSNVQHIDVSHNVIEALPNNFLGRFREIEHLNLSHNLINSIGVHIFEGTVNLKTLDLSHNKLHEIGDVLANLPKLYDSNFGAWTNLGKLSKLILDDNFITFLNFTDFFDTNLRELSIGGNKIPCEVLASAKYSNTSEKFDNLVTANEMNCHSKNVNGIPCLYSSNNTDIVTADTLNVYNSPIILLLKNAIEENTKSLKSLVEIVHRNEETLENITKTMKSSAQYQYNSVDKLSEISNKLQQNSGTTISDLPTEKENSQQLPEENVDYQ